MKRKRGGIPLGDAAALVSMVGFGELALDSKLLSACLFSPNSHPKNRHWKSGGDQQPSLPLGHYHARIVDRCSILPHIHVILDRTLGASGVSE
jgi:hypothetical protein